MQNCVFILCYGGSERVVNNCDTVGGNLFHVGIHLLTGLMLFRF